MRTYVARLMPESSVISPWHSDTLFGQICWMIRLCESEAVLNDFLDEYRAGTAPFVISSGFPNDLLPKPMLWMRQPSTGDVSKKEGITQAREGKRLRAIEFLNETEFLRVIRGEAIDHLSDSKVPGKAMEVFHNQINRLTDTTAGSGQLYSRDETFYEKESDISIYLKINETWVAPLKRWLELLGQTGFGKRRSVGKGFFRLKEFEPYDKFDNVPNPNAVIYLSNCVPATDDPVDGRYRLAQKYGKLGNAYAACDNPFKHPFIYLQPGAAFRISGVVKPYYGRMIANIAPAKKEVVQYGLAFAVPAVFR
ncbi:hypothetical protein GTO89_03200 [Heliobacterium gestii]|uniref:CRISPR system Cms protein Csm4 n=1 Tax=Heliomicrobium gestii TaxID=2699 RepID=A0A845L5Z5_HELGE|nr:hypothetical protein [Heliomicrobium gestii]MBM7865797.1 CRISPR-associated protein Csm4 [Heliomicrobium gestii]MZP42042.1 hypothetical protein [Heliomicrobium gestii]